MQQLTQIAPAPAETLQLAAAALSRLSTLNITLTNELKSRPKANAALINVLSGKDTAAKEAAIIALLKQLHDYWQAPAAAGSKSRRALLTDSMEQALRDEVIVKNHEQNLDTQYTACLPLPMDSKQVGQSPEVFSLHVQLSDKTTLEIAGALVFISMTGLTLLVLPGIGAEGFASRTAFAETLVQWLNNEVLRHALFSNAAKREQQILETITRDPALYLESFTIADLELQSVAGDPFAHAFERQLDKQRSDVRHACLAAETIDKKLALAELESAISMQNVFGPGAMLEQREMAYWERQQRKALPDWIKRANQHDLDLYQQRLTHYEQSRAALLSALNGGASHAQFAQTRLRARLASDLGYDLEPGQLMITTQRELPITGETYTVKRSLLELALYGLHLGDKSAGSAFLTRTTLSLDTSPTQESYPLLTCTYLANLVEELDLGSSFREYQRTTYASEHNQQLMRDLTRKQINALAWAARMQGHIQQADFDIIEKVQASTSEMMAADVQVQQIKLDNGDVLSGVLVFRKNDAQGRLERLVMFTADAPRAQHFQGFDNQTQLLHELVSWTTSPEMSHYLLKQVPTSSRDALDKSFAALRLKPAPPTDYVQLITRDHYDQALRESVRQHVRVAASNQAQRTPDWYLRASPAQRQELLALEEALNGAMQNYQARAHTRFQAFEAYVHQRASEKISQLLGVTEGSVDPDLIIITSQREVLSYTQMLRNGYDDSLGLINTSADTQATFSGPEGLDLTLLTPQKVARSVHGKWLSDDYIKQVRATLLDAKSSGYPYRQRTSLLIIVLQMKAAALRGVLKGQISGEQYQWLKRSINNLHRTDSYTRSQYPIYALQLRMENPLIATDLSALGEAAKDIYTTFAPSQVELTQVETVQGCYLLASTEVGQAPMIYTPLAPDGIDYRLLSDFKASLSLTGMIDYYKDRCRIDARRKLAFFLRDMEQGGESKPPVIPRDAISDFRDTCFNRPIERQLRDVEDTTTGRSDMLARLAWTTFELLATVVTLPFPPASFAVGALLSLHDSMKALQAFANGDRETASGYILSSLFNSLGAAGDLSAGMKGFGALRQLGHNGSHASALSSTKPLTKSPSQTELLPVRLEGELFWRSKPNANGHASVFRATSDGFGAPQATGQFARREGSQWRPLSQPFSGGTHARLSVNVSLKDTIALASGHGKGVSPLNGKYYIELQAQVFEVQFDAGARCWNIVDPQNPFAFFGKQPVRLDAHGKWQLLETPNLRGGMDDSFKPLVSEPTTTTAEPMTAAVVPYELPLQMRVHFSHITQTGNPVDMMGLGLEEYFESVFREMRSSFAAQREKLYRDAQGFFASALPAPRPALPLLDVNAGAAGLIKKVFENSNAMVIAEAPRSIASKRLLIENMAALAEQDVKVLYLQHLFTDLHMYKLEKYRKLGARSKAGSSDLKVWLEELNSGALKNGSKEYDYYHLIKAAHHHGLEVRPLSSSVSYPLANKPVVSAVGDFAAEQKMSNFFSRTLIDADMSAHPTRRWVALLDQKLANTHQQVPGIAELHGAVSVRVQDVPNGRATRINRDIDNTSTALGKADFKIEMANPLIHDQSASSLAASTATTHSLPSRLDDALYYQIQGKVRAEAENPFTGKPGFEWSETSGWQQVDAQHWPVESPPTAIQLSLRDNVYTMPVDMRDTLHELINFESRGLDSRYFSMNKQHSIVSDQFFKLRNTLQKDARNIIARELPARPPMPAVAPGISQSDFLEELYQHTDGIVIGEAHSSIASKKLVIDNLPLLARQDVKTLYVEHLLTDLHQADLDRFVETGHMSKGLLHDLKKLDRGHHTDSDGVYNFEQLIIRARGNGLEIRAIDCSASYYLKDLENLAPTTRQQMFSHYASRTLRKHQEVMGSHKWIALVGNSHANTFEKIVPGLAELEGGIGVRVVDVRPGQARGISIDPGEKLTDPMNSRQSFVKSDYRVETETLKPIASVRPAQAMTVEERLTRPGMFLVEESDNSLPVIVHRSRDNAIHHTPVKVNAQGQVYVERATWTTVNLQPYQDVDALIVGLEEINLTRVA